MAKEFNRIHKMVLRQQDEHDYTIEQIKKQSKIPSYILNEIYNSPTPSEYFISDFHCTCDNITNTNDSSYVKKEQLQCLLDNYILYLRSRHVVNTNIQQLTNDRHTNCYLPNELNNLMGCYNDEEGYSTTMGDNLFSEQWYASNNNWIGILYQCIILRKNLQEMKFQSNYLFLFALVGSCSDMYIPDFKNNCRHELKICPITTTNRILNVVFNFEICCIQQFVQFCKTHVKISDNILNLIANVENELKNENKFF